MSGACETIRRLEARIAHRVDPRFVRFLFVGVLNTLFGYGVYALCLFVGLHYAVATLLSTVLGVLFNFVTTGRLVFSSRENRLLWRFALVYALLYLFNIACIGALQRLGMNAYWAGALMLFPMAVLAFVLNKKLVFRNA
ncbi:GtrA family protein [Uliginosibacterium sp. sgz301328]|uniref:GtrA family protein n=1 Tax=Uliginosibacterium sp. sgz301328 TaxID=3243764 RepID=UPI00359CE58D